MNDRLRRRAFVPEKRRLANLEDEGGGLPHPESFRLEAFERKDRYGYFYRIVACGALVFQPETCKCGLFSHIYTCVSVIRQRRMLCQVQAQKHVPLRS